MSKKLRIEDYTDMYDEGFHRDAHMYIPAHDGYRKKFHGYRNISFIEIYKETAYDGKKSYRVDCHTTRGYIPITTYSGLDEDKAVKEFLKELEGYDDYMKSLTPEDIKSEADERFCTERKIYEIELEASLIG